MQVNLLKSVVSSIVGQSAAGIVDLLHDKKNVNEFLIAKKLKLTINQTRNILYRLADEGIVSFIRKKDRKKGGWYTYFWTLNTGKGIIKFKEHLVNSIDNLKKRLDSRRKERFFHCLNCEIESNEETALLHQYTCPECGEVLQLKDKGKEIESLEREIAKLENILVSVNQEMEIIVKAEEKVSVRKQKAETKKKAKERAIKKKKKEIELRKATKKKKKKPSRQAKKSLRKKLRKKLRRLLGR